MKYECDEQQHSLKLSLKTRCGHRACLDEDLGATLVLQLDVSLSLATGFQ